MAVNWKRGTLRVVAVLWGAWAVFIAGVAFVAMRDIYLHNTKVEEVETRTKDAIERAASDDQSNGTYRPLDLPREPYTIRRRPRRPSGGMLRSSIGTLPTPLEVRHLLTQRGITIDSGSAPAIARLHASGYFTIRWRDEIQIKKRSYKRSLTAMVSLGVGLPVALLASGLLLLRLLTWIVRGFRSDETNK